MATVHPAQNMHVVNQAQVQVGPTLQYPYPQPQVALPYHSADITIYVTMVNNGYIIASDKTKYIAKDMEDLQIYFLTLITAMQLDKASRK